jgi:[FeFe] hydrogenase H-cluster maturation GTPase HydF
MHTRQTTPRGLRLQIGIFGRRNVGKSSLFNRLLHQEVSIVSEVAGTTTDPVEKAMELQPLGPVLFVDTAGIDDVGALGAARVARSRRVLERVDLALLVTDDWGPFERGLLDLLSERRTPLAVICAKSDLRADRRLEAAAQAAGVADIATVSALTGDGIDAVRALAIRLAPDDALAPPALVADLVPAGAIVVLVVPIDKEAPKGRLILPQVQAIRDLLDNDACALVVKERELAPTLQKLRMPPALVVTDSQAFLKVAADTPADVPMTSFSILLARQKGDLAELVRGALAIDRLQPGARVLIAETCTHHPIADDIGRVKIPRWLEQVVGGKLAITHVAGCDQPVDFGSFDLVIQCGSCMWTRREVLGRMAVVRGAQVPMTNYGLAIAFCLGILERALQPFPYAHEVYRQATREGARLTAER